MSELIGLCTDSNSEMSGELIERYDVEVVPLTVTLDGRDHLEGVDLEADTFYEHFVDGRTPEVATSQPSPPSAWARRSGPRSWWACHC